MTVEEVRIAMGIDQTKLNYDLKTVQQKVGVSMAQLQARVNTSVEKSFEQSIKGYSKIIKGFGVVGLIESVVAVLTPATLAVSKFFGEWSAGGEKARASLVFIQRFVDPLTKFNRKNRLEKEDNLKTEADFTNKLAKEQQEDYEKAESHEARMFRLKEREAKIEEEISGLESSEFSDDKAKVAELRLKLYENGKDIVKETSEMEKEAADADLQAENEKLDALFEQLDLEEKITNLKKDQAQTEQQIAGEKANWRQKTNSEFLPTISELAKGGSQYSGLAAEYQQAKQRAETNLFRFGTKNYDGSDTGVNKQIDYANSLKNKLADVGLANPVDTIADATKASAKHLEEIKTALKDA